MNSNMGYLALDFEFDRDFLENKFTLINQYPDSFGMMKKRGNV